MSKFFGGRDPFGDPFFSDPYAGMYHTQTQYGNQSKEVTIEELDSDGNPLNAPSDPNKDVALRNPDEKKADTDPGRQNASGMFDSGWSRGPSWGGLMLPSTDYTRDAEPSDGSTKKVVRINVE